MKLSVDHIREKGQHLQGQEPIESFPVLAGMQKDGICSFTGPVAYDIRAEREYDHLRVSGTVSVPLHLACSRCLSEYASRAATHFTIIFRRGSHEEVVAGEETELNEQDLVSATYSGDEIDLTHEIEEQIAMEIPIKPLCGEACKGLCPSCGTDLNKSDCTCQRTPINFKFSALKDFKANR